MKTGFETGERESNEMERISQLARQTVENIEKLEKATGADASRRLSAFTEKLKKSRLLKTLIFATASHAAILESDKIADFFKAAASRFENWDGHVMTPQNETDRHKIKQLVADRESRINQSDLAGYKQKTREKLSHGEDVSFEDIEFNLEEKNGVPHEQVESARKKAHEKMDKWRPEFVDGVNVKKLDEFVKEMYGPRENYSWGQGIVSTYFNTGIRNCHSVAKGQLIVLDNLMQSMSPEERRKIVLGTQYVEAHEYATLTILGPDKKPQKTYLLEPGIREVAQDLGEAGTATVSLGQLKQAIVAEKPVIVDAKKGDIEKGPKVDFTVNQAVDDNIVINGPLKPSDFVLREMGEKPPEHVEKTANMEEQITDPTIMELTLEEEKVDMTVEDVQQLKAEAYAKKYRGLVIWKGKKLSPEIVREINAVPPGAQPMSKIEYQDIADQPKESVDAMFHSSAHIITFRANEKGSLPPQLIESLYTADGFQGVIEIQVPSREKVLGDHVYETQELASADFEKVFKKNGDPAVPEIRIVGNEILHNPSKMDLVLNSGFRRIVLDDDPVKDVADIAVEKAMLQKMIASRKTFILTAYHSYLDRYPDVILDAKNITSIQEDGEWMSAVGPEKEIALLKTVVADWNMTASHKRFVPKLEQRIAEMEKRVKEEDRKIALKNVKAPRE